MSWFFFYSVFRFLKKRFEKEEKEREKIWSTSYNLIYCFNDVVKKKKMLEENVCRKKLPYNVINNLKLFL